MTASERNSGNPATGQTIVGFIPRRQAARCTYSGISHHENVALRGAGHRRENTVERSSASDCSIDGRIRCSRGRQSTHMCKRELYLVGNQQKLTIGREMEGAPTALVAENPTRGLDVQATAAVHHRLREARLRGTAIVLYSSDSG